MTSLEHDFSTARMARTLANVLAANGDKRKAGIMRRVAWQKIESAKAERLKIYGR